MDACARCGAPVSADLEWCPRCYAPAVRRDVRPPAAVAASRMPAHEPPPQPVYSRWRAGPTSFGAGGRVALTVLVLLGSVAGYPMSRGEILAWIGFDLPGTPFLVGYAVVAGLVALYLLSRIWKPARIA